MPTRAARSGIVVGVTSLGLVLLHTCCQPPPAPGGRLLWSSRAQPLHATAPAAPGTPLPDSLLRRAPLPAIDIGDLVRMEDALWVPEVVPGGESTEIRLLRLDRRSSPGRAEPVVRFAGSSPRLAALGSGDLLLVQIEERASAPRLVARRGRGRQWTDAVAIVGRASATPMGSSRAVELVDGELLVAVLWRGGAAPTCYASRDGGTTWSEIGPLPFAAVDDVNLVATPASGLLAVGRRGPSLYSSSSPDAGRTWSEPRELGVEALATRVALASAADGSGTALAWTDPSPDTTMTLPGLQALRCLRSPDGGRSWADAAPLVLWPGRVPLSPSLWLGGGSLVAAFVDAAAPGSPSAGDRVVCIEIAAAAPASPPGRYSADPRQARDALRFLCAHTLARPTGPRPLFVEGYFMRTLVAAHAIFDSLPGEVPMWFDPHAGLERARTFADQLVATQDAHGYWPLGYGAVYIADMGAALGLLPALETHVAPERASGYEAAARRFAQALERDGMILPSGALGVGWWGTTVPRIERRASREPYLVSTALAGVELHAWLHRRSKSAADRERAVRALDWTLSRIQADGALEAGPKVPAAGAESPLVSAVYAQEGWMAADVLLGDPATLGRLRRALPPHVDWLLRLQRADGRWDEGADGEFARTPAIVDFLVWYDQRCEARDDVRDAVRRAGAWLVDPSHTRELYRAGNHYEVLRAIGGRTLAALGQERFAL